MAATVTLDAAPHGRSVSGDRQIRRGTINLGVYATNGVAVTKSSFDLPVDLAELRVDPGSGIFFEWDKTNGKVKAFWDKTPAAASALTEVTNATDISTTVVRFRAEGK